MKMRKKLNIKIRHCVEANICKKILNPSFRNYKTGNISGLESN